MSDIYYKPLIEEMTWSFSRIDTYNSCPYQWFLKYIKRYEDEDRFYARYGKFMHTLLEKYYSKKCTKDDILIDFLFNFSKEVRGLRPSESTVQKYIELGTNFIRSLEPIKLDSIDVEKEVFFKIGDKDFIGYVDLIGEENGEILIIDHKSRDLKQRSGRAVPTTSDLELDEKLKQLYLYSVAIEKEYGRLPKYLCFNCFKSGQLIKELFDIKKYEETKKWALDCISKIENTEEFEPNPSYFRCRYLCGVSDRCIYDIERREERGRG